MPLFNIATEDALGEALALKILQAVAPHVELGLKFRRNGNSYLKQKLPSFRQMAVREPILILTDLDNLPCPVALIQNWSGEHPFPENLLLRVAVQEAESWVLADRSGVAQYMGVSVTRIPHHVDSINNPKEFLLNLAKRARREVRSELVISRGAIASQGLGYNRALTSFVGAIWNLDDAVHSSESLSRTVNRIRQHLSHNAE